jgi:hypothetical protein
MPPSTRDGHEGGRSRPIAAIGMIAARVLPVSLLAARPFGNSRLSGRCGS